MPLPAHPTQVRRLGMIECHIFRRLRLPRLRLPRPGSPSSFSKLILHPVPLDSHAVTVVSHDGPCARHPPRLLCCPRDVAFLVVRSKTLLMFVSSKTAGCVRARPPDPVRETTTPDLRPRSLQRYPPLPGLQ
eukprot:gene10130-biopygen15305